MLANGAPTTAPAEGEAGTWTFATTPPLPPAMFVMCAGPWASVRWEHAGLPFGWHARQSLAPALERDADELRRITEGCFDHYARIFDEPYAYDSYDQAMVPGQNWGAMETPGCVTYRDEMLPLGRMTEGERRSRAMVIAHEMAHMWFGDLVTMTWWEDTWLQESFADYMGFRVSEDAAGVEGAFVDFTVGRKPGAYAADQRRSTHPVAAITEDVTDVDVAAGNFDAISYAKGNSVLRQLVTWLGDEPFLAGVNTYLTTHRHGNATLADFVAALDAATDRDVRSWVEAWLRTTGFDTLRVGRDADGPFLVNEGSRPHRVRVSSYDDTMAPLASVLVDVPAGPEPVRLPDAPVLVPNAAGETYARVRLDEQSWAAVSRDLASLPDDTARAVLWATAFDLVAEGELPSADFLGLVTRHLSREPRAAVVEAVLAWCRARLVPRYVAPADVPAALAQLAAACESGLASEPDAEVALALTRALAATTPDTALLERWLVDRETHTGVTVDGTLRWLALHRLAGLGALDAAAIEEERVGDGTIVGDLGALRALAARPDAAAKAEAWSLMVEDAGVSNRAYTALNEGFWNPEQLALVGPYLQRYLDEAPAVAAARGQAYTHVLGRTFPAVPLSDADRDALGRALARDDLPTLLRRHWQDRYDDLVAGR